MISAGQLTTRIEILSPRMVTNDFGEEVAVWDQVFCRTRCSILKRSSRRALILGEVADSGSREIIMRYRPGITSRMRVRFVSDGSVYMLDGLPTPSRADGSMILRLSYLDE